MGLSRGLLLDPGFARPSPFTYVYHQDIGAFVLEVNIAAGSALCEICNFDIVNGLLHVIHVETDVVNAFDSGRSFTQIGGLFAAEFQDGEIDIAIGKPDTFVTDVFGLSQEFIPAEGLFIEIRRPTWVFRVKGDLLDSSHVSPVSGYWLLTSDSGQAQCIIGFGGMEIAGTILSGPLLEI